jgi:hypothetical protein
MMMPGRADYMDGGAGPSVEMGVGDGMGGGAMNGRGYRPPDRQRGICRDYHSAYHNHLPWNLSTDCGFQIMATVLEGRIANTATGTMLLFLDLCSL